MPSAVVSGAARTWPSPYTSRTRRAIRSAASDGVAGRPRIGVLQVAERERRRVIRDAGAEAHEVRCQLPVVLGSPDHHDVVGGRGLAEVLGDRIDDGVGRHRARQATQDPRERLGLVTPPGAEIRDGGAVDERRESGDQHDDQQQSVGERRIRGERADEDHDGDQQESDGEGPPGPADPAIRRVHGARGARGGGGQLGNIGCGPDASASTTAGWYRWGMRPGTSVLIELRGCPAWILGRPVRACRAAMAAVTLDLVERAGRHRRSIPSPCGHPSGTWPRRSRPRSGPARAARR